MQSVLTDLVLSPIRRVSQSATYLSQFITPKTNQYRLDHGQRVRLERYLSDSDLVMNDFGDPMQAHNIVAFSFGDSAPVNRDLAKLSCALQGHYSFLDLILQQEIYQELPFSVQRASAISSAQYQTTRDVAEMALANAVGRNLVVVAQAWHAKRCVETCQSVGFNVVALRTVGTFPANDPQPWVRNPINWVLKESNREVATGYEISQQFGLA